MERAAAQEARNAAAAAQTAIDRATQEATEARNAAAGAIDQLVKAQKVRIWTAA